VQGNGFGIRKILFMTTWKLNQPWTWLLRTVVLWTACTWGCWAADAPVPSTHFNQFIYVDEAQQLDILLGQVSQTILHQKMSIIPNIYPQENAFGDGYVIIGDVKVANNICTNWHKENNSYNRLWCHNTKSKSSKSYIRRITYFL
jgi:hypothetical protein